MKLIRHKKGIGLLELMLALAVIAILLILATRYYGVTQFSNKIKESINMIEAIKSGSARWYATAPNYDTNNQPIQLSIDALIDRAYVPTTYTKNPWGGDVEAQEAPNKKVEITFEDIPIKACNNLVQKYPQQSTTDDCGSDDGAGLTNYVGIF